MLGVLFIYLIDQLGHANPIGNGIIQDEKELWRIAQVDGMGELAADKTGRRLESLDRINAGLIISKYGDIDLGCLKIRSHLHQCDAGHEADPGILDIFANDLGELAQDLFVDTIVFDTAFSHTSSLEAELLAGNLYHLIGLNLIVDLNIRKSVKDKTALITGLNFPDVILEAL